MITADERHPAHLDDFDPAPRDAVLHRLLFQADHAVGQALELGIAFAAAVVVDQEHRARPSGEELLQPEDLPAIPERVAREQPEFRQRIERHSHWLHALDHPEHLRRHFAELDLCRVVQRVTVFLRWRLGVQLTEFDGVERPPVRRGDAAELAGGLRERDVHAALPAGGPLEQELQRQRRLSGTRPALNQVQAVGGQATAQQVVQPDDAGADYAF